MPYDLLITICNVVIVLVGATTVLGVVLFAIAECVPSRSDASDLDEWDRPKG